MNSQTPVSRGLARIIREVSKSDTCREPRSLADDLRWIEERQAREVEFYLRTCSLRLESAV